MHRVGRRQAVWALLLLVPVPSFGTWMAMVQAEGTTAGQIIFGAAKLWVVLLPLGWLVMVEKRRPAIPRPSARGMPAAVLAGVVIVAVIAAAYWLLGPRWIDAALVRERAIKIGLGHPAVYLLGALYWCTINSLLEEYVWRWFVATRCERLMPRGAAVIAAGLFFTFHHIIGLDAYFDWRVTALGSLGVFIGGATWSWLYLRYRNIYAAYVSHVFADVVIFGIGWFLLFGG